MHVVLGQIRLHQSDPSRWALRLWQNFIAGTQNGSGIECVIEHDVGGTRMDVCVRCGIADHHARVPKVMAEVRYMAWLVWLTNATI